MSTASKPTMDEGIQVWIGAPREEATKAAHVRSSNLIDQGTASARRDYSETSLIAAFWGIRVTNRRLVKPISGNSRIRLLEIAGSAGYPDSGPALGYVFRHQLEERLLAVLRDGFPSRKPRTYFAFCTAYTFWQQATGFQVVLAKAPSTFVLPGHSRLRHTRRNDQGFLCQEYDQPLWVLVVPVPWWKDTPEQRRTLLSSLHGYGTSSRYSGQVRRLVEAVETRLWLEVSLPDLAIESMDPDALQL